MAYEVIPGIYKMTNKMTGKVYIGQSKNIKRRWNTHKQYAVLGYTDSYIHKAIAKYGWDAFDKEILIVVEGRDDMNHYEQALINQYGCMAPAGYNLREGGWSGALSPESIEKGRQKKIGRKWTLEQREKILAAKTGKPLSAEHKAKLREKRLGAKFPPEFGAKISAAKKGKRQNLTDAQRAAKSEAARGRTHSEETKQKIRKWNIGRKMPADSKIFTDDYKKRMSALKKGIKPAITGVGHTEAAKQKMRDAWAKRKAKQFITDGGQL